MFKKIAISGLFLLGFIWRIAYIWLPSYWIDEAFSIQAAKALDLTRAPLYHGVLAVWGNVFGWYPYTLRLLSVLVGLAACVVVWKLAQRWFGAAVGYISFALMLLATLEIAWSRQVRMYIAFQCALWLTLWLYAKWRQPVWIIGAIVTIGTHELGWMVIVITLALSFWQRQRTLVASLGLLVVVAVGMVALPVMGYPGPINYVAHYGYFILTHFAGSVGLAIIALWYSQAQRAKWASGLWLIWVWWIAFCSLVLPLLHYRYIFVMYPALLMLAAVGTTQLWKQRWLGKVALIGLLGVMCVQGELTLQPKAFYALESDSLDAPFAYRSITPQPNFEAAYQYLNSRPAIAEVYTPYPAIHKLYSNLAMKELPMNLTDPKQDRVAVELPEHGTAILDDFAKSRLANEVVAKITNGQLQMSTTMNVPYTYIEVYTW